MVCTVLAVGGGILAAKMIGRGFGRGDCGGGGRGHGHGPWGIGRSHFLRRIFRKLDTTPGQEKVIREALSEFREAAKAARPVGGELRHELAGVLRQPVVSDDAFTPIQAKSDEAVTRVRSAFQQALTKIHETLDATQREALAEILESRWMRPNFGGPYRT